MRCQPMLRKVVINRPRDDFNLGKGLLNRGHPGAASDDECKEENAILPKKTKKLIIK